MKSMLDTQIYDLIADTSGMIDRLNVLSQKGKLTILSTHIQEDELAEIPDEQKKAEISRIIRTLVTTSGAVYDVSRYGQATYGEGGAGGVKITDVRSASGGHARDALIATTAARDADVLVTEDRRLTKRMQALKTTCQVWGFGQLKEWTFQQVQG